MAWQMIKKGALCLPHSKAFERILQIEIQPLPTNGKPLSGHKQVRNQISVLMSV